MDEAAARMQLMAMLGSWRVPSQLLRPFMTSQTDERVKSVGSPYISPSSSPEILPLCCVSPSPPHVLPLTSCPDPSLSSGGVSQTCGRATSSAPITSFSIESILSSTQQTSGDNTSLSPRIESGGSLGGGVQVTEADHVSSSLASAGIDVLAVSSPSDSLFSSRCPQARNYGSNSVGGTRIRTARRPKRIRTIFTADQLDNMERAFSVQQYMVGKQRCHLARALDLHENQVKVWFQNRRIKWRRQNLELEQSRLALVTDSTANTGSPTTDSLCFMTSSLTSSLTSPVRQIFSPCTES